MATKKMEGRIKGVEEQIAGVHGEMSSIKGDLQRLGPLEVKVDSMLEKLSLLERMEKMLQKWENSEKGSSSEEKKDKSSNPKDPNFGLVTTTPEESSIGANPRNEPRVDSKLEKAVNHQERVKLILELNKKEVGLSHSPGVWRCPSLKGGI